jgi:hypothetical protein
MSEKINFQPWLPGGDGDFCRGLDAEKDADPEKVLDAFLWDLEGLTVAKLTETERDALMDCLTFMPMFSVIKIDWDDLGEDCEWHTDGHGKRCRPTWWLEYRAGDIIEDVVDRLQSECSHANINESGLWCNDCGYSQNFKKVMA